MAQVVKKSQIDDIIKSLKKDLVQLGQEASAIISDFQKTDDEQQIQSLRKKLKDE